MSVAIQLRANVFEIKDLFVVSGEKNAKLYNVRGQTLDALTYIIS
jgi:hypothetical protein